MTKNSKKAREKTKLEIIEQLIAKTAKEFKVEPFQVNKIQFWDYVEKHDVKDITEWDLRKLGGFDSIRDQVYPPPKEKGLPENPLTTEAVGKLRGHELSSYIAEVIRQSAEDHEIVPHELTWVEFRNWGNIHFGKDDKGIGIYNITRAGGFNQIRDAYFPKMPTSNTVDKKRLLDQAKLNRRLGSAFADQQFILENIEEFSKRVFSGRVQPIKVPKGSKKIDRVVNAVLSDLHIGSDIVAEETGYQTFGKIEESRRLAALTKQICSYKEQYRDRSSLALYLLGDIIQNSLHDARDGAVMAEQFSRAVHLLSQVIAQVAASYSKIDIYCATGNHGRDKARHFTRAVHQKWDSRETEIYVALRYACMNLKNVTFHIPKTPYIKVSVLEHTMFGTHGDTVLNPGMPGKAINIKALENQINKINASLTDNEEYSVFFVGHVHTPSLTFLDNGAVMLTNGCLVPVDDFAVSIGLLESHCGQWIWESIKGHPVGDIRLIKVGLEHDKDASLDKIIKPWTTL
jgi:hypothetical protein